MLWIHIHETVPDLWLGGLLLRVVALIAAAWAFGAVWFDGPFGAGNKLAAALLAAAFAGRAYIR